MSNSTRTITAFATASALALGGMLAVGAPATAAPAAAPAPLTNTAHLDYLLDTASPAAIEGHTTYRLAEEPELTMPWTYADARDGGTFERVGGGPLDPVTGDWGQGAYNADDVSRAAVVYLRHWRLTGDEASRDSAYELLRSLAYFQTADGPNAGNVVLWMQTDGDLNPSAEPVELPDPSDSAESYWLARTVWALGEGVEAFAAEDPEFTAFLRERLDLSIAAVDRQVLDEYGVWDVSDGVKVPAWLIADGADATAEAVLGLAAYVRTAPDADASGELRARTTLAHLAEGVAAMGAGDLRQWPYGAVLQWTHSRSIWHAWGSQMPAALAAASVALGDPALLRPAIADAGTFTPTLLTAGGPDNAWLPSPIDRTQIAYGADSRLQSLLAVADATGSAGFAELAAIEAAWFFGTNASGAPVYDPATGITFDGVAGDGTVNRNSGAESTIHGLLAMLALDAHPAVGQRARSVATVVSRDGLRVVEAETAASTNGEVVTPESAWTGESQYSGGSALALARGDRAAFKLGATTGPVRVEPVLWLEPTVRSTSVWTAGRLPLGVLTGSAGAQGVSEAPGALLAKSLTLPVPAGDRTVTVRAVSATTVDALLVRPVISSLSYSGAGAATQLFQSSALLSQRVTVGWSGATAKATVYRADGSVRSDRAITGRTAATLAPGDFAVVTR